MRWDNTDHGAVMDVVFYLVVLQNDGGCNKVFKRCRGTSNRKALLLQSGSTCQGGVLSCGTKKKMSDGRYDGCSGNHGALRAGRDLDCGVGLS